jgi:hypothetical protein
VIKVAGFDEERLDEELILLHPQTLQVKLLNETATTLWDALDVFATADELVTLLVDARPELGPDDARRFINTFLDELVAAGLVEPPRPAQ